MDPLLSAINVGQFPGVAEGPVKLAKLEALMAALLVLSASCAPHSEAPPSPGASEALAGAAESLSNELRAAIQTLIEPGNLETPDCGDRALPATAVSLLEDLGGPGSDRPNLNTVTCSFDHGAWIRARIHNPTHLTLEYLGDKAVKQTGFLPGSGERGAEILASAHQDLVGRAAGLIGPGGWTEILVPKPVESVGVTVNWRWSAIFAAAVNIDGLWPAVQVLASQPDPSLGTVADSNWLNQMRRGIDDLLRAAKDLGLPRFARLDNSGIHDFVDIALGGIREFANDEPWWYAMLNFFDTDPTVVILGQPWAPYQSGYGTPRPDHISNGGDPTGVVQDVHWDSWGGDRAVGAGINTYVGPEHSSVAAGHQEPAVVVAFDRGMCAGRLMYRSIEWYFPQHGQEFDPLNYIDICTGTYVTNGRQYLP